MDLTAEQYFECRDERNIYNGFNPCPSNMEPYNGICTDRLEIAPTYLHKGQSIQCSGRANGNYKSENNRRCSIYYTCVNGIVSLTRCEPGKVFDSKS